MFTVCPKCALTLVVTAADLRAAQGYVRCGRCSNVFNALARLVEDRASAAAIQASPPPAPPEQPQAELEADKTQLAQAQESQAAELEAGETQVEEPEVEETRIEVIEAEETQAEEVQAEEGDEPIPEGALEFNPEATDVSKVFIEATPTPQWTAATGSFKALILKSDETPPAQPPQEVAWPQEALQGQEKEKEPAARTPGAGVASAPVNVTREAQLLSDAAQSSPSKSGPTKLESKDGGAASAVRPLQRSQPSQPKPGPKPVPKPVPSTTQAESTAPARTPPEPQAAPRPQAPAAAVRLAPDKPAPKPAAAIAHPQTARAEPTAEVTEASSRLAPWWNAATAALAIILAAQIVNHYRNDLAANERLHKPLTALYAALGVPLAPRWDLEAYDVRQLGASVDSATSGQITVRASVKNGARQPQPLPLLRVTLQDRFGNRVAARDVPPQSYLPRTPPASSFLSAGQRIDAEMVFVDPGANAVGFEIDACLPAAGGAITCASDAGSSR